MKKIDTSIEGAFLFSNSIFTDERGFFKEIFLKREIEQFIKNTKFVQENHSRSVKNVLRGLHYQNKNPQGQLVTVFRGEIYETIVDLRINSSTFKKSFSAVIGSNQEINQIYTPPGVAGGFLVTSEEVDLNYKVTEYYDKQDERGVNCFDPELGICWPEVDYIMNVRDKNYPILSQISEENLPKVDSSK
jgi:dTDP-4-dehydrorhamnose 3,5-epimerase